MTAPMTGTLDFLRGGLAPNSGSTITREGGPRDCLRELLDVEKRCLEAIYTVKSSTESCSEPYACQKIQRSLFKVFAPKNDKNVAHSGSMSVFGTERRTSCGLEHGPL